MKLEIVALAFRNLIRRPVRTLATFLALVAVSATLYSLTVVFLATTYGLERGSRRLGADAMVIPSTAGQEPRELLLSGITSPLAMDETVGGLVAAVPGVGQTASQLFVISAPLACCSVSDTTLIGFEPGRDFTVTPWLRERMEGDLSADTIIVGDAILAEPGGRMRFFGQEFRIAGKLEQTGMGFLDSAVFVPMGAVRRMVRESGEKALTRLDIPEDRISAVFVRFQEGRNHEETAIRIEATVPGVTVILASDFARTTRRNLLIPLKAIVMVSLLQWMVSLFLVGVLHTITAGERKKEIGLLKAMGARAGQVRLLFVWETLMVSCLAGLAGMAGGSLLIMSFQGLIRVALAVPFLLPPPLEILAVAVGTLLLTVGAGLAVSWYPMRMAANIPPYDAMRQGE